ncbi:o-succinylbenzoate synthase [Actinomarinicola tropica]|uniref:o-succinylbenzoate synthase n=1 Tax=Actinomarinicola tropica TaxID=2789776 RepID=UPI00189A5118|nr:o-succinylbenzoate synthase [Actinomarinicola tropica]
MSAGPPVAVELRRVEVPLVAPIVAAHGVESVRKVVLVRVVDEEGRSGWGECEALAAPTYTSEWHDGAWAVLRDHVVPAVLDGRPPKVVGHPMAWAAVEVALVDLSLRAADRRLVDVLGAARPAVASRAVVGIATDPDALVHAVGERIAAGHRAVKLKIRPGADVEPLRAVRSAWPHLALAADANGSYDLDAAQALLRAVDDMGLDHVEQLLPAGDLVGAARLRQLTDVPLALDESLVRADDLAAAVALGAVDVVNLKPARVGGLTAATEVARVAREAGLRVLCGGMYELGVGRAVSLAVAGSVLVSDGADIGPTSAYVRRDLVPPIELDADGALPVPHGPGIGVTPDAAVLEDVTVERWVGERR